jgi:TRAP-type transport system periplasmic protein
MGKRVFAMISATVMLTGLLTGCLKSDEKKPKAETASSGVTIQKDAKIIKVSNGAGPSFPAVVAETEVFKKMVEEKTNGRYKVEVYHSGQLGDDVKATEALRAGSLEACMTSTAPLVGFTKELAIFDIPFLFTTNNQVDAILDGPIGQKLSGLMPSKDLINLAWGENGFRQLTNSVREVKTPADIKGLKIRTMENTFHLAAWRAMGANPTPMAFTEVFTALQQKSIDGQENPIANFYSIKIYEVNKFISLTGHVYSPLMFLFSKKIFDTYPKEDQEIIREAAKATALANRKINRENEGKLLEEIKKSGAIVTVLTPAQKKAFQDKTAPVWKLVEEKVGSSLIKQLKSELAKVK